MLVRVRVPETIAEALAAHVSSNQRTSRSNGTSLSRAVVDLLQGVIDALKSEKGDLGKLIIAEAVRESAQKLHYTTVADVRKRLQAVPEGILDSTLLKLEREGAFKLAPSYNGNVLTDEERAGGIKDAKRGNLVYAVTDDAPKPRAKKAKRHRVR